MKSIEIKATHRKEVGKKYTQELRKKGLVPCVMYGGEKNVHFSARVNDLRHIIYTHDIFLIDLDIEGEKHQAILKDSQFHPVSDEILHLDFIQVFNDKPATVELPVTISGNSSGIRAGGKLRQRRRYLKAKGLIGDLPEYLDIDITNLEIGDFVKVGDLKFENLELLDPARAMVVGVSASRLSKGMEAGVSEGEEVAESQETAEGASSEDKPSHDAGKESAEE